ncbi:hypothetical protein [uncultured Legionella sp.]|uniref:hypothetical protein n=1 Tax=uncultured Legionella sp. TaxID=210934 RepID=UPI0026027D79|nr:hypothetical protein [uncultured Legionella sp.]
MSKIINFTIIIIIGFFCSPGYSQKVINLSPNESKMMKNGTLWTINATCTIQGTVHNVNKIKISVLKNNGTVNGKALSTGQTTFVTVKNNSSITVSAESGTQINLINLGSEQVQAVCYT